MSNYIDVKERNFSFDALRVIAILAVIMIHISAPLVVNNPYKSLNFIYLHFSYAFNSLTNSSTSIP